MQRSTATAFLLLDLIVLKRALSLFEAAASTWAPACMSTSIISYALGLFVA
jgi:hypothetical protein